MRQWYYSQNGKAQGPVEENEIGAAIKAGEISHLDLVFQVGGEEWLPASQIEVFSSFFKENEEEKKSQEAAAAEVEPSKTGKADWVVLRKLKEDKDTQYKQLGPFTKEKVLDLLDQGEILFTDYAWKSGMESWVAINKIEEFGIPLPSSVPVEPEVYETEAKNNENTNAGKTEITSLTELVEIEKFQREKTQVMSATQIREHWQDSTMTGLNRNLEEKPVDPSQLWSLEPPTKTQGVEKSSSQAPKPEVTKNFRKVRRTTPVSFEKRRSSLPRLAAVCALLLSVGFLYFSFTDTEPVAEVSPAAEEKVSDFKAPAVKKESPRKKKKAPVAAPAKKKKVLPAQLKPKKVVEKRKVAAKKKKEPAKPKKKIKPIKPKKVVEVKAKKVKEKPKPKPVVKKAPKKKTPRAVRGSKRERAFYMQRDRKVLFYSSLEAERLVLELEANFKKLSKKQGQWKKFYRRWNRNAQGFLHPLLKRFPESSKKYAFPNQFSSFKRDHEVLLDYGRLFNAKALGLRQPASPQKDMKRVFAKYQEQARNLGR